ncbi:MAG: class I SAM-dependent methyltransferase [Flavobacteriia bacterium]|nr:class I SAM-dependent methyltransferase [Flavobacteriia bacterium]
MLNNKTVLEWDVKTWSKALNYWEKNLNFSSELKAIELGSRGGGLSIYLASKGINVICSDLEGITEEVQSQHKNFPFYKNITYQKIDCTNISYENSFDVIIFKSILGGVGYNNRYDLQKQAINEMYKALKPGGVVLFAENLKASPLHQFFRKRFTRWGSSWRYISISEIEELFTDYKLIKYSSTGFLATFGRNERQRSLFYYLDTLIFNHITPKSWKYMVFGLASK